MTYLRDVPFMGVIFVVDEAMQRGFTLGDPSWINLGQGQPEVGPIPGAPRRIDTVTLDPADHAYGPVNGLPELRTAVADYYNRTFRTGLASQYGAENVAIVQGGRLALSRALAALGDVNLGYMLPDYSAYEDMLGLHLARVTPIPVRTDPLDGFRLRPAQLAGLISDAGIGAFLLSNPCNPTGALAPLAELIQVARDGDCALLLDEFYSHYVYESDGPVSAAAHVTDVNTEQVLLFDGLTKNHRYPGWRLGWVVGPADTIAVLDRVGSALDGGPSRLAQRAALAALQPERLRQETGAVRAEFRRKQELMVRSLKDLGVRLAGTPEGTFYVWGCLEDLPAPFNDGMEFFRRALDAKVLTVPGELFDVNPGKRRPRPEYRQWMRFSFGPSYDAVAEGLTRLATMVAD